VLKELAELKRLQALGLAGTKVTDAGLKEVANPSAWFLSERPQKATGSVVVASLEGTRPILIELQALVSPTSFPMPRRTANGVDGNRIALLVAVMEKRMGLNLSGQDIYVNVVGGLRIEEPALDLGIVAAVTSSLRNRPIAPTTVVFGEVGLGGEVRAVGHSEIRLREAAKLGFSSALVPRGRTGVGAALRTPEGIAIDEIEHLADLVARFQPAERPLKRARREGSSDRGRE